MKKLVFFVFLFVFLFSLKSSLAAEFSVGVSPSLINLDQISPGTSKPVSFFIVTASDETLLVYLEPSEPLIDFFDNPSYKGYLINYSQEPTSSWVQTFSNPVELKPQGQLNTVGGTVKGWREINFLLNIPDNVEPGYHLVKIFPRPYLPSGSIGQVGVQIAAITPVTMFFRVPGDAIRDGKILDVTTGRQIGNNIELFVHFINTGTVSISAKANEIKIYGKNSTISLSSDTKLIRPGETQVLTSMLSLDGLEQGEYNVFANVDFITGSTSINSTVRIYPKPFVPPTAEVPKPVEIPLWLLIFIGIIIIGIIVYRYRYED